MVKSSMRINRRGLHDWMLQRLTAFYLAGYVLFMSVYLWMTRPITYTGWNALFSAWPMKIATVICFAAITLHAWIGIWTILTDYVKFKIVRTFLYACVWLFLFSCLLWGILILWSV